MTFVSFVRSTPGRVGRVCVGVALVVYGATHVSLVGLVLMMIGVVPVVTGLADLCLPRDVTTTRHATGAIRGGAREGRA